jgi:hypothetical protein
MILDETSYRYAGLRNREIGELITLDYSAISVRGRRLRKKLFVKSDLFKVVRRIEEGCQE